MHLCLVPTGQLTFASAELLHAKWIDPKDTTQTAPWAQTELLLSLDDISAAFWKSQHGTTMQDELDNHPFDKCVIPAECIPVFDESSQAHSESLSGARLHNSITGQWCGCE